MAGSRRALLVGINAYPGAPLAGCVADVAAWAARLEGRYGFPHASIRLLTDARATTAAIKERLAWLVAGAQPGDELVYAFSGHGVQLAARNDAGELDRKDECQCPVNFDWSNAHVIRDNDLAAVAAGLPAGAHLTVISDSCHSGTLARELLPFRRWWRGARVARTMPLHADVAWRNAGVAAVHRGDRAAVVSAGAWLEACGATQTAADARFNGGPRGAFSYYLGKVLDATPALTLADLRGQVNRRLAAAGFEQDPVFEGAELHRPFLGGVR